MRWASFCVGVMLCVLGEASAWLWSLAAVAVMMTVIWRHQALPFLVCLLLGFVYAFWRMDAALTQQIALDAPSNAQKAQVQVWDVASHTEFGQSFVAQVTFENGQTHRLQVYDAHAQNWRIGQVSACSVRVRAPVGMVNASGFHAQAWFLAQNLDGSASVGKSCHVLAQKRVWFWQAWRERAWQRLENLNPQHAQGAAMVAALTVGLQDGLSDDTWQAMRQLGVVHLVSISGVHVTMLAFLVAWLVGKILRFVPYSVKTPMLWQCWAGVAVAVLYATVAGLQIPTQRTVWMLLVFAIALTFKWRMGLGQVWWVALTVVVVIEPAAFLSVGLWLSFGLVAIMIWVQHSWHEQKARWRVFLRLQMALFLLSLVLVGAYFHQMPLLSPLANVFYIPWFSWVLTPSALVAMVLPWDAPLLAVMALAQYSIDVSVWLANYSPNYVIAQQSVWMLVLAMVAAYLWCLPNVVGMRWISSVVLLLWLCYRPPLLEQGQLRVEVLDVGQGLAVLLNTQNHRLLFDTAKGSAHAVVLPALYRQGWRDLDALVLSHNDADHDGAAAAFLQQVAVKRIWSSRPEVYPKWTSQSCREQAWQWDGVWFEWLTLPIDQVKNTTNASSCVLRVVTNGQALLLPADIGHAQEALLLEQYGQNLHSTVLVLGHHGSSSSSSGAWLNTVAPELAIASSGWRNQYHHPTPSVQNRLSAHDIQLYRTDLQGGAVWLLDDTLRPQKFTGRLYWWQSKPLQTQPNNHK